MENVVTISLGGAYSFAIERTAAKTLEQYLSALRARLGDDESGREVLLSIEERIVELFTEWVPDRSPITLAEVERAKATLGTPDEVCNDGEDDSSPHGAERRAGDRVGSQPPPYRARLYRDPQRRILGGVCGGLSARMGIPVWILRTSFIILSLFYGVAVLVYLILWLALPLARTRLQQMEMRGDPLTFSTIEEKIQHEYQKMRAKAQSGQQSSVESFFSSFAMLLGSIGVSVLKYGIYLFGALLIIGSVLTMLALLIVLFASVSWSPDVSVWWSEVLGKAPFLRLLLSSHTVLLPVLLSTVLLLFPLLGLCFGLYCLVRRSQLLKIAMVGFVCWLGALVGVAVLSGSAAIRTNEVYSLDSELALPQTVGDTLVVTSPPSPVLRRGGRESLFGLFFRGEDGRRWQQAFIRLAIKPLGKGRVGRVVVEKESYGTDEATSERNLQRLEYPLEIAGNRVVVPTRYTLRRGGELDGVINITVTIYVAEGVYLRIDDGVAWRHLLWDDHYQRTDRLARHIWFNSGTEFVSTMNEPFDSLIEEFIPESVDEV